MHLEYFITHKGRYIYLEYAYKNSYVNEVMEQLMIMDVSLLVYIF